MVRFRRLSFAMKQHIKSLSIPRTSTISYSSTCSGPFDLYHPADVRRPSDCSFQHQQANRGSKTSFSNSSRHTDILSQPMILAPPELAAHLERTQMKLVHSNSHLNLLCEHICEKISFQRKKTMTYKLGKIHPIFVEREQYSLYVFSPENKSVFLNSSNANSPVKYVVT